MKEKFSDYESAGFLNKEGEFEFEITDYELKDSSKGDPMAVFGVKTTDDGSKSTIYHSLNPKARWSYNNLIKACLKLATKEQIMSFECDYEIIGQELVGEKFIGVVKSDTYLKPIKVLQDDGTYADDVEEKTSYKITEYKIA